MRTLLLSLLCYLVLSQGSAFVPSPHRPATEGRLSSSLAFTASSCSSEHLVADRTSNSQTTCFTGADGKGGKETSVLAGFLSGSLSLIPAALASTEVELADLPPPYIPVIFGLVLIVGVGLLTGSLGDVIDDEAQLGMQSGARAKKEIERTRSSYFKKK